MRCIAKELIEVCRFGFMPGGVSKGKVWLRTVRDISLRWEGEVEFMV